MLILALASCQPFSAIPTPSPSSAVGSPIPAVAGQIVAKIDLGDVQPWRIAWGENKLWVLGRQGAGTVVLAIDPDTNTIAGHPIHLKTHGWEIAAGEGGVWVGSDSDASITRIDPLGKSAPVTIGGARDRIGPAVAVGFGFVWTGDSDQRAWRLGQTVSQIDPATNRVIHRVIVGQSPQTVVTGADAVWAVNHDDGTVTRIDPSTRHTKTQHLVVRPGSAAAAHGGAAGDGWVGFAATHDNLVIPVDPVSAQSQTPFDPGVAPLGMVVFDGRVWVGPSMFDENIERRIVAWDAAPVRAAGEVETNGRCCFGLTAGDGSVWAGVVTPNAIVRIQPSLGDKAGPSRTQRNDWSPDSGSAPR
jgi:hypothetical protein